MKQINYSKLSTRLLSLMLVAFLVVGCANRESQSKLLEIITSLDRQCPIKYDFATFVGARIIDDEVVFNYVYDESLFNLDIISKKQDLAKRFGGSMIFHESGGDELAKLLISSDYGLKLIFKGSKTKKETNIQLSKDEILEIRNNPESKEDMLNWQIEVTNSMLPQQVDEFTELISLEQDDNSVSYIYNINEDKLRMEALEENKDEINNEAREELATASTSSQSTAKAFLKLVRKTGKNLKYVYKGSKSGKTVTIEFSNHELRKLANNDFID